MYISLILDADIFFIVLLVYFGAGGGRYGCVRSMARISRWREGTDGAPSMAHTSDVGR